MPLGSTSSLFAIKTNMGLGPFNFYTGYRFVTGKKWVNRSKKRV